MGFSQKVQSKLIQLRGWHQIINPSNLGIDRGHKPYMRNLLRSDSMKEEQCRVLLDNCGHGGWPTLSAGPQRRGYYREMG